MLADYIRKDFCYLSGEMIRQPFLSWVLPYFESIRRKLRAREYLCLWLSYQVVSLFCLPMAAELKELLPQVPLSFSSIGHLDPKIMCR